jgi:hypothetical protein
MALVMMPCDMPWWPQVQRLLNQLQPAEEGTCVSMETLTRVLTNIHTLCK